MHCQTLFLNLVYVLVLCLFLKFLRHLDALALIIILEGGFYCFLSQHGAMYLLGGQSFQRLNYRGVGELQRLVYALALYHLCGHGAGGQGRLP